MEKLKLDFDEKFLLILHFSKKNHTLITRAIKILFLIEEIFNLKGENELEFIPYDYGPYALNFNINVTPLINEELISYRDTKFKEFFFNKKRKPEIIKVLKEELIENNLYHDEIELIMKISNYYDHSHTNELIQLCYFLKPKFTAFSYIKEDIKNVDMKYNQNHIIDFFTFLKKKYFLKLLEHFDGILKLFNINENNIERDNFYDLLHAFLLSIKKDTELNVENYVKIVDNISTKDSFKTYKFLKFKLLEFFLFRSTDKYSFEEFRKILIFIFKSLTLDWPLDKNSMQKFKGFYIELKPLIKFESIDEKLEPLNINYEQLKKELDQHLKSKKIKEMKKTVEIVHKYSEITHYMRIITPEKYNLVESIEDDFSKEEIDELEKSEEDFEKPIKQ